MIYQPAKPIRTAAMVQEPLGDARESSPDEASRKRLREIYAHALDAHRPGQYLASAGPIVSTGALRPPSPRKDERRG
jgi:hypothetical protein